MVDYPTGSVHRPANNYVWDSGTLSWVVETQPGGGGGGGLTNAELRATPVPVTDSTSQTYLGLLVNTIDPNLALNVDIASVGGLGSAIGVGNGVPARLTDGSAFYKSLTDTQLRASAVPVSLATAPALVASSAVIGHVIADTGSTTAVTGNVAVTSAGLTNLDVALSTRTKPADQQHTIIDSSAAIALAAGAAVIGHVIADTGSTTAVTGNVAVTSAGLTNLDVALSTRLKPADTLTGVTTVATVTTITNAVTVTPPTLTKATQGATGFSTQDLKDAGRVSVMITASVASTATAETLITLTRSIGLATVGTGSSLTITTGKRFRIQALSISARNTTGTTAGNVIVRLRAAVAGATTASSPLQMHAAVALPASAASTLFSPILIPDGFEIDSNGATNTFGITITHAAWVTASVVATFDLTLVGYEY